MTIHDRVKLVIKWLIGTGVAKNQESIGRLLGYSNKSSFSQILNNKVPLPNDFIDRLCILNGNINKVWIEEEVGNMIADISTPISPINENRFVPSTVSNQSDTIALRLMDKLDEKDNIISEKEAKIEELLKENGRLEERIRQLESQDKESEQHSKTDNITEAFTSESFGDYGEDSIPTKLPSDSKRSSAGKV